MAACYTKIDILTENITVIYKYCDDESDLKRQHRPDRLTKSERKRGYQFLRSPFVDYKLQLRFMPPALS